MPPAITFPTSAKLRENKQRKYIYKHLLKAAQRKLAVVRAQRSLDQLAGSQPLHILESF